MALANRGRYTDLDKRILQELLKKGPMTLKELRTALGEVKSTCESAVKRLEEAGFIERVIIQGKRKLTLKSKEITKLFLDKIDKFEEKLKDEKLETTKRKEYESYIKHLSKIKLVTPMDYRSLDFRDWLEFLVPSKEVDASHPFFYSMKHYVNQIRGTHLFDELIMIKIVSLLRDLTLLYYFYWQSIVHSSSPDELENTLFLTIPTKRRELYLYKELEREGKASSRPSLPEEFMRELSMFILRILRNQVIRGETATKLESSIVIEKIDRELVRLQQAEER